MYTFIQYVDTNLVGP